MVTGDKDTDNGTGLSTLPVEPRNGKWFYAGSEDEAPVLVAPPKGGAAPEAAQAGAQTPPQRGEVRKARDGRWLLVLEPASGTEKGRYIEVKVYQTAKGPRWHDEHGRTYKAPVPPEAVKATPPTAAGAPAATTTARPGREAPAVSKLPAKPKPGDVGLDTSGKTVLVTESGAKPVSWYPGVGWLLPDGSSAAQWLAAYKKKTRKQADDSLLEQP
jgi:hypothetical protein